MGILMGLHESVISSMSFEELMGRKREEESMLEELKASQVHDALDVELPEASVVIVLAELVHRGLVERRAELGQGRRRASHWYRAAGGA